MRNDPYCETHQGTQALYDSFGYPYCPRCEDDSWANYYRHLVTGHTCDACKNWTKRA